MAIYSLKVVEKRGQKEPVPNHAIEGKSTGVGMTECG